MADMSVLDPVWERWDRELKLARKAKGLNDWISRGKKIIKRYRDERTDPQDDSQNVDLIKGSRFNILWSNTQTLIPAVFAKAPKPVVERRYLDRDEVGRVAGVILERALCYEIEEGCYASSLRKAVLDWLLPGRGVVWVRYDAKFRNIESKTQETGNERDPSFVKDKDEQPPVKAAPLPPDQEVASESVPIDYVDWRDFLSSPSRTWEEVTWIAKRVYMTRKELIARFGEKIGSQVTLDWEPKDEVQASAVSIIGDQSKRAKVWEIWSKTERRVYWMAETWSEEILDHKDDPLKLEGFFPIPKPLFATLTNDTLVPVSFYYEYQDQANELDDLTARIASLTKAIKAAGIYDASIPEIRRLFEEGFENSLVPCDSMAAFAQKAGPDGMGAIWLLPIKDMAAVLIQLYQAREQVKQVLYEITGISDIVRGQAGEGGAKTATEQRIKGQFASMRLNDLQAEVARFARDTLRIMGELISEHFDPMTLYLVSGYEQYAKEQFQPEQPSPPPSPMMGHNGGPPMNSPSPSGLPPSPPNGLGAAPPPSPVPQPIQIDPETAARQKAADVFKRAVELLRNDKLRGFRIDIETDSLIEPDQQETQRARTELLGAISQFLPQAMEAGQAIPAMRPLLGQLLLFFLRGFKAGRDLEAPFEQFIDDMKKEAKNPQPPPPSPEEIKAQAEIQKQQMEGQRMAAQFQMDQQKSQLDLQSEQMKLEIDRQRLELEKQKTALEMQAEQMKAFLGAQSMQTKAAIDQQSMAHKAQAQEATAAIETEQMERQAELSQEADARAAESDAAKHKMGLEVMEAKAKQAKRPNGRANA